jgi:hypothetical protein
VLTAVSQVAASGGDGGEGLKVLIPLFTSAIALAGVLLTLVVNGRRTDRNRRRELYAGGWSAVQAYKEAAFAIRRRNANDRAAERVRLSESMREIQRDLSYHEALIGREQSGDVAVAYRELVAKTREVAGGIVKRSWDEEPIASDNEMHAPAIASELQALAPYEVEFMDAVAGDVGGHRSSDEN